MRASLVYLFRSTLPLALPCLLSLQTGIASYALAAPPSSNESASQQFFRIKDQDGKVQIKSSITPEEASAGYEVINSNGEIVKVFLPLDENQRARIIEEQKIRHEALLLRYSDEQDLEAEKKRKLADFDIRISRLKTYLLTRKEKVAREQSKVANFERRGMEIPETILKHIAELEEEMIKTRADIDQKKLEKAEVEEKFEEDARTLRKLLEKIYSDQSENS